LVARQVSNKSAVIALIEEEPGFLSSPKINKKLKTMFLDCEKRWGLFSPQNSRSIC
jgi:hypothetical protein